MKPLHFLSVLLSLLMLDSCTSSQPPLDFSLPELLYQHPLPAFPTPLTNDRLRIPLEIHVTANGTVGEVRILQSSGISDWDSAAVHAIRQWKYIPARTKDRSISLWLRQTAVVQFSEPRFLNLAEIVCNTESGADSAVAMLEQGRSFEETVGIFSVSSSRASGGTLGRINIRVYPEGIQHALSGLKENAWTTPLPFGDHFIIFKRIAD